jgi:hypothetical protein
MLQTAGLRVTDVRGVRHSDWLRVSAKRASGTPLGDWLDRVFGWNAVASCGVPALAGSKRVG